MAQKEKKLGKKIFDVEIDKKILETLVQQEIDKIDPNKLNDNEIVGAVSMGIAQMFGSVMNMALPDIAKSINHDIQGYRIIIERMDKIEHPLDISIIDGAVVINTKIKNKIEY